MLSDPLAATPWTANDPFDWFFLGFMTACLVVMVLIAIISKCIKP